MPAPLPIDADLDVDFVDRLAQREAYNKHLFRPNTYMHKWWARRCGTTFRSILKALVEDRTRGDFYAAGGLEGKLVLDPMVGGGTTLHEALRLGANVFAADIDPIPILQAEATLQPIDLDCLQQAFDGLHKRLCTELGADYLTETPCCDLQQPLRFVLFGQRQRCDCGERIGVDSLVLRYHEDGSIFRLCAERHAVLRDERVVVPGPAGALPPLVCERRCPECGARYRELTELPYYRRLHPLALFGRCPRHGVYFKPPDAADLRRLVCADAQRTGLFEREQFVIPNAPKSQNLRRRNIDNYLDLFSGRQLKLLYHAGRQLSQMEGAQRLNLALLLSTALEFNSLLCGYKGRQIRRAGAIKHTFVQHGYAIPRMALENNALYPANRSGTLMLLFRSRIVRGRRWAAAPVERRLNGKGTELVVIDEVDRGQLFRDAEQLQRGERRFWLWQGNSAELPLPSAVVDYVITDPPYYDSVQYGDLAQFFHVWLRQFLPDAARWDYRLDETAVNQHQSGDDQYGQMLAAIFQQCRRVLKKNGRFIFTYHHWDAAAWSALTLALQQAQFELVNRYVVHAESPRSVHIAERNALLHDVILVCAVKGAMATPQWPQPQPIFTRDSRRFCEDCGAAVGWLLQQQWPAERVAAYWQRILAG